MNTEELKRLAAEQARLAAERAVFRVIGRARKVVQLDLFGEAA